MQNFWCQALDLLIKLHISAENGNTGFQLESVWFATHLKIDDKEEKILHFSSTLLHPSTAVAVDWS